MLHGYFISINPSLSRSNTRLACLANCEKTESLEKTRLYIILYTYICSFTDATNSGKCRERWLPLLDRIYIPVGSLSSSTICTPNRRHFVTICHTKNGRQRISKRDTYTLIVLYLSECSMLSTKSYKFSGTSSSSTQFLLFTHIVYVGLPCWQFSVHSLDYNAEIKILQTFFHRCVHVKSKTDRNLLLTLSQIKSFFVRATSVGHVATVPP